MTEKKDIQKKTTEDKLPSRTKMDLDFYMKRIQSLTGSDGKTDSAAVDILYKRADLDGITRGTLDKALKKAELGSSENS